jgi:WD40 repeat protein
MGAALFKADGILCLGISPGTGLLAAGLADGSVTVLQYTGGKIIASLRGHKDEVLCLAFSTDKKRLVSGGQDGTLRVWDFASGKQLRKFVAHKAPVASVAWHPDGNRILSGDAAGHAILWEADSGKVLHDIAAHRGRVGTVSFGAKGARVVTGGADHIVRVWNVETGKQLPIGPDPKFNAVFGLHKRPAFVADAMCVAVHKETGRILSGDDDGVYTVWGKTGTVLERIYTKFPGRVAAFFPDGNRVVIGFDRRLLTVHKLKPPTGLSIRLLSTHLFQAHTGTPRCAAVTPDGKQVLSGGADNLLRLWDATTHRQTLEFKGHTKAVVAVAIHPEGDLAASAGWDGRVCLWDMHTGRLMRWYGGHRGAVTEVEWLDDYRIRSAGLDTTALTWRTRTMTVDKNGIVARLRNSPAGIPALLELYLSQITDPDLYKSASSRKCLIAMGDETVAFLETRIFPVVGAPHIEEACKGLAAEAFKDRKRAKEMLRRIGAPALTRLKELAADTGGDPEVFLSARELVTEISAQPVRPALDIARAESVVPVLEWIGTERARALLQSLTRGVPEAGLTRSAKAALKRLQQER